MREPNPPSILEQLISKIELNGDCWEWGGSLNPQGYGQVGFRKKSGLAHRATYSELVGDLPDGSILDHVCRNRKCVNPDHLEIVTQAENVRRGAHGAGKPRTTHCPKGHEYTPENTIQSKAGGRRNCKLCHREVSRNYWRRTHGVSTEPQIKEACGIHE